MEITDFIKRRRPIIIAHRGGAKNLPEIPDNSIKAIEHAIEAQAEMIEFDVRFDKDQQIIIFHDNSVNKIPVTELSREEIGQLTGTKPILLTELLKTTQDKIMLNLEIKDHTCLEATIEETLAYHSPQQLIVSSFYSQVVKQSKLIYPEIKTGLLLGIDTPEKVINTRWNELFPKKIISQTNPDFIAPYKDLARLNKLRYKPSHSRLGMPIIPWTVNSDKQLKYFLNKLRVPALITDYPERAKQIASEQYTT
jgi:glycerophosphoryl diester phosphodiesterase